jgi:hypothetical protein
VSIGAPFSGWQPYQVWDRNAALERLRAHEPGPFDVDVELQEEVVLPAWELGKPKPEGEHLTVFPVEAEGLQLDGLVSKGIEGQALHKRLEDLRKAKHHPPLFGLLHYEKCRLRLQPLSLFGDNGPEHLMLSGDKIDKAALLKTMF